ncbi:MAG: hypothetical protein QW115_06155 [Thermoplasmata archaeon]
MFDKMPPEMLEKTQKIIEEYIGPFLAEIITKKALSKANISVEALTISALEGVIDKHIVPALMPLLSKEKVQECRRRIVVELRREQT